MIVVSCPETILQEKEWDINLINEMASGTLDLIWVSVHHPLMAQSWLSSTSLEHQPRNRYLNKRRPLGLQSLIWKQWSGQITEMFFTKKNKGFTSFTVTHTHKGFGRKEGIGDRKGGCCWRDTIPLH